MFLIFVNEIEFGIKIGEGNVGCFCEIVIIFLKDIFKCYVDLNVIYREYFIEVMEMWGVWLFFMFLDEMINFGMIKIIVEEGMIKMKGKFRVFGNMGRVLSWSILMEWLKKFIIYVFSFWICWKNF